MSKRLRRAPLAAALAMLSLPALVTIGLTGQAHAADSPACDSLKNSMDWHGVSAVSSNGGLGGPNHGGGFQFLLMYAQAAALGCDFIHQFDNPHHVDPEHGTELKIQLVAQSSSQANGPMLQVRTDDHLVANDGSDAGGTTFRLIQSDRPYRTDEYYIVVDDGDHAGKCLTKSDKWIIASTCNENTSTWLFPDKGSYRTAYVIDSEGYGKGNLSLPGGKAHELAVVADASTSPPKDQRLHFRPADWQ
ncbi:hypothetical protein [Streptomyces kronopolitis]|uniref:hypothetical protein n=1 Tax=Streptomyces kronopolitis TaxID=1612435 RepID=UPI003441E149